MSGTRSSGEGAFLKGFLLGAILGAGAAALLAPRSGPETRELIREQGLSLKDRAEDAAQQAQDFANERMRRSTPGEPSASPLE